MHSATSGGGSSGLISSSLVPIHPVKLRAEASTYPRDLQATFRLRCRKCGSKAEPHGEQPRRTPNWGVSILQAACTRAADPSTPRVRENGTRLLAIGLPYVRHLSCAERSRCYFSDVNRKICTSRSQKDERERGSRAEEEESAIGLTNVATIGGGIDWAR